MTSTESAALERCVAAVSEPFDAVFSLIARWRVRIGEQLPGRGVTAAELDAVVDDIVLPQFTAEENLVIGAGFVAAPGSLLDARWHISWWLGQLNTFDTGTDGQRTRRLAAVEEPESEYFRDYTALEWWRVPAQTGRQHITGPYVDYLCTDEYTLTLTTPVYRGGALAGVVGADLYVDDIESVLLPRLRELGPQAALVNASTRIVASSDARHSTGSLLRADGLAAAAAGAAHAPHTAGPGTRLPGGGLVVPCGETSLSLVIGPG